MPVYSVRTISLSLAWLRKYSSNVSVFLLLATGIAAWVYDLSLIVTESMVGRIKQPHPSAAA